MKKLEIDQMSVVAGGGASEVHGFLCGVGLGLLLFASGPLMVAGGCILAAGLLTGDTTNIG